MKTTDTANSTGSLEGAQFLQHELTRRITANSRYSLRAFARALKMSPAMLSLVLSGKRPLSAKGVEKIRQVVPMSPEQGDYLQTRARRQKARGFKIRDHRNVKNTTLEIFTVLSQWYHFAILSLLELSDSSVDPRWIAKKLGITHTEAKLAVDRLMALGFIAQIKGRWKQTSAPMRVGNEISTQAARQFQKQLLEKALFSLENDDPKNRDVTSMVFAMDPADLTQASQRITEFRRALTAELEADRKPKAVYSLTIQLFPITKEF